MRCPRSRVPRKALPRNGVRPPRTNTRYNASSASLREGLMGQERFQGGGVGVSGVRRSSVTHQNVERNTNHTHSQAFPRFTPILSVDPIVGLLHLRELTNPSVSS